MILGLGTDMIEIARIQRSLTRYGDAFLHRIYTPAEIAYCQMKKKNPPKASPPASQPKRLPPRRSAPASAAVSPGASSRSCAFPASAPRCISPAAPPSIATHLGVRHVALSLSHTRDLAIAIAVAED